MSTKLEKTRESGTQEINIMTLCVIAAKNHLCYLGPVAGKCQLLQFQNNPIVLKSTTLVLTSTCTYIGITLDSNVNFQKHLKESKRPPQPASGNQNPWQLTTLDSRLNLQLSASPSLSVLHSSWMWIENILNTDCKITFGNQCSKQWIIHLYKPAKLNDI